MVKHFPTIIIGGGQSGLSISYFLKQTGLEHVIFEKADRPASAWRNRWDSFTLVTPNWMLQLPGAEYRGDLPEAFLDREEVIAYFESYIQHEHFPIRYGIQVSSLEKAQNVFQVKTNQGDFTADNVVVAVGFYQQPKIPPFSQNCSPDIYQIHSEQYRNPGMIPEGAVLVVGSAQSGSQLAEELNDQGRKVFLSVSETGRFPADTVVRMRLCGWKKWAITHGLSINSPQDRPGLLPVHMAQGKTEATPSICTSLPGMASTWSVASEPFKTAWSPLSLVCTSALEKQTNLRRILSKKWISTSTKIIYRSPRKPSPTWTMDSAL